MARLLRLGAAMVAAAVLAGCASASPAAEPSPGGAGDALVVSVFQGRLDGPARRIVVKVENTGDAEVEVQRMSLASATLAEPAVRDRPFTLAAGDRVDIRLPLPDGACDADAATAQPSLELDVATGGAPETVELVPEDPFDVFRTVNDADCLAVSVADVAAITLPERLEVTGTGPDQRATIVVGVAPAASGSGTLEIASVAGTTLLNSEAGGDWPVGLAVATGDGPATVRLDVRPARCDAHAIADDKRGTILPFAVRTGDGREGRLELPSGDPLKADLYAYVSERCGLG